MDTVLYWGWVGGGGKLSPEKIIEKCMCSHHINIFFNESNIPL